MAVKKRSPARQAAQLRANKKYNATKRGKVVARVTLTESDDETEWAKIVAGVSSYGDNFKDGLYKLGKKLKMI